MSTGVPVGAKFGRYEVVKHLARGGMADLSIARASGIENFERHVVIKHLRREQSQDSAFVQMFVTEARLAGTLHHHNIVQVYDIGQEAGAHFFAMEYVHGEDLRRLLSKLCELRDHCPLQHVITIATAVAAALHHAHEQKGSDRKPLGIVHRDVTPANIIVGYDGNIKVVDFGIAKAAMRTSDTAVGMLKGKVPYMAPEQCTGKPVDRRSDVFALGIVLYELVTVRRLFKGGNEFFTMTAVVQGEIPKPSLHRKDMPPALEQIVLKALARKPQDRYQTADELRLALDQFADKHNLRTSTTALADYMKKLFGEKPEPWADDKAHAIEPEVDFDNKTDVGLAAIPSEAIENNAIPKSIATTRGSLIEQARLNAISNKLDNTPKPGAHNLPSISKPLQRTTPAPLKAASPIELIKSAGLKEEEVKTEPTAKKMGLADTPLISPPVVRASSREDTKPDEKKDPAVWMRVSNAEDRTAGEVRVDRAESNTDIEVPHTNISTPPPPPETRVSKVIIAAGIPSERDNTEIVTPLPVVNERTTFTRSPVRRVDKRWLFAGGIAATALVIAIIIMATGRSVADQARDKPVDVQTTQPPPPPTPDPAPEPDQKVAKPDDDKPTPPPAVEDTKGEQTADTAGDPKAKIDDKVGDPPPTGTATTDGKTGDKTDPAITTTRGRNTTGRTTTRTGSRTGTGSKNTGTGGRGSGTKPTTKDTSKDTPPTWNPNELMPNWKKPKK